MFYDLLNNYFSKDKKNRHVIPLAVDVRSPDYFLYLYAVGKDDWLVVAETDYFFMNEIVRDIEGSFPVEVQGWYKLKEYRQKTGDSLLPPSAFKAKSVNENDEEWANYHGVITQEAGIKYAVLRVKPRAGTTLYSFGLTFYSSNSTHAGS